MRALLGCLFALFVSCAHAQVNPGTSPLTIAKGGTNAATASAARTSLGLAIGSNVEAWDADLDCLAALGTTGVIQRTGSGTCAALTNTQLTALINAFTTTLNGAVPAPATSTGKFLRDDATWQPVSGSGTITTLTAGSGISLSTGSTCTTTCTISTSLANSSVTGASTTYTSAQNGVLVERSNSGSAMVDTLPGTSPGILPAGTLITVSNNDTAGLLVVCSGSGASIKGGALLFNGCAYAGPGQALKFYSDASNYWPIGAPDRAKLAANTTLLISASGNDTTGNGITAALATTARAWSLAQTVIDHNGFVVTYSHATGNYPQNIVLTGAQVGSCGTACDIIQGNTTTPSNVTFPGTGSGITFTMDGGAQATLQGVDITNAAGQGVVVTGNSILDLGSSACGANTCNITGAISGSALTVTSGMLRLKGNYTINGNQGVAWYAHVGGVWEVEAGSLTVTLSGAPTITTFADAAGGRVYVDFPITFSGSPAAGTQKWIASDCGSLLTGATTFPGTVAGAISGTCGSFN